MRQLLGLSMLSLLTACGGLSSFFVSNHHGVQDRKIASVAVEMMMNENSEVFGQNLDEKLGSLHIYHVLAQKNLSAYDQSLNNLDHAQLASSREYLNLLAIRTQVDELEHDLTGAWKGLSAEGKNPEQELKRALFLQRVNTFADSSKLAYHSMEGLVFRLGLTQKLKLKQNKFFYQRAISPDELEKEFQSLSLKPEFQVYEKNVEHLSHVLSTKVETGLPHFKPSALRTGNITGNEFPAKVWSLTFDDGPAPGTSPIILKNLKEKGLKATFFQLTGNVKEFPELANTIRDAGMEIGSHSWNHPQFTKLGAQGLEKESVEAVKKLEEIQKLKVKFFRLPYGDGVDNKAIREKIASMGLIHVYWNIDTLDWVAQTPEKLIIRVKALIKKSPKDAGVILFHDIQHRTTIASAEIMDYLKKDGRRVCTLDEIVTQMNEGAETVCPQK